MVEQQFVVEATPRGLKQQAQGPCMLPGKGISGVGRA